MWGKSPPKLHPCLGPAIAGLPPPGCARGNALCSITTVWLGTPAECCGERCEGASNAERIAEQYSASPLAVGVSC